MVNTKQDLKKNNFTYRYVQEELPIILYTATNSKCALEWV